MFGENEEDETAEGKRETHCLEKMDSRSKEGKGYGYPLI